MRVSEDAHSSDTRFRQTLDAPGKDRPEERTRSMNASENGEDGDGRWTPDSSEENDEEGRRLKP